MNQRQITGLSGDSRDVAQQTLDALAAGIAGSTLYPEDEGFADATLLWNGMITKRPAVVVRPESNQDVVEVVNFARENELELSIKGAGHNIAGLALSDGGITLDMSGMKGVDVDSTSMLARVGPGCTLGDVDAATQEHGLATTLGFVSATGCCGAHAGRRVRLPDAAVRLDGRRPRAGGGRDRRRDRATRVAHRE